jgi:DNA helicase-2/ATP-dependent DNA helicase PcrA
LFYVGITRAEEKLWLTCAEQRRRNGELMFSMPSRFLKVIAPSLAERARTARARVEGRGAVGEGFGSTDRDDAWGRSSWSGSGARRGIGPYGSAGGYGGSPGRGPGRAGNDAGQARDVPFGKAVGALRAAAPHDRTPQPEDESQDVPLLRVGERVRHARFGSGTIAELSGTGRDAKVRIDFDDAEIGRKTLVLAQAKLERGWD